jgi:hypothetical protein
VTSVGMLKDDGNVVPVDKTKVVEPSHARRSEPVRRRLVCILCSLFFFVYNLQTNLFEQNQNQSVDDQSIQATTSTDIETSSLIFSNTNNNNNTPTEFVVKKVSFDVFTDYLCAYCFVQLSFFRKENEKRKAETTGGDSIARRQR